MTTDDLVVSVTIQVHHSRMLIQQLTALRRLPEQPPSVPMARKRWGPVIAIISGSPSPLRSPTAGVVLVENPSTSSHAFPVTPSTTTRVPSHEPVFTSVEATKMISGTLSLFRSVMIGVVAERCISPGKVDTSDHCHSTSNVHGAVFGVADSAQAGLRSSDRLLRPSPHRRSPRMQCVCIGVGKSCILPLIIFIRDLSEASGHS